MRVQHLLYIVPHYSSLAFTLPLEIINLVISLIVIVLLFPFFLHLSLLSFIVNLQFSPLILAHLNLSHFLVFPLLRLYSFFPSPLILFHSSGYSFFPIPHYYSLLIFLHSSFLFTPNFSSLLILIHSSFFFTPHSYSLLILFLTSHNFLALFILHSSFFFTPHSYSLLIFLHSSFLFTPLYSSLLILFLTSQSHFSFLLTHSSFFLTSIFVFRYSALLTTYSFLLIILHSSCIPPISSPNLQITMYMFHILYSIFQDLGVKSRKVLLLQSFRR